jgi:hypothetical protein
MAVVLRLTVLVVPVRTTRWAMKRSRKVGRIIARVTYMRSRWTVIRVVDFDCT